MTVSWVFSSVFEGECLSFLINKCNFKKKINGNYCYVEYEVYTLFKLDYVFQYSKYAKNLLYKCITIWYNYFSREDIIGGTYEKY